MKTDYYQQAISEPHSQCPDFLAALASDPALVKLQQEQLQQEQALLDLFSSAPEPSNEHLETINSINQNTTKHWSSFSYLAVAASLILCVVSLKYIDIGSGDYNHQLTSHVLNHTAHGHSYAGVTNIHPSLAQVKSHLAVYGANINNIDNLVWNKNCDFEGITSAHLIYQEQQAKINVYLVPDSYEFTEINKVFEDERYHGTIKKVSNNYLVIIGPKGHDLGPITQQIDQDLHWQI